MNFTSQPCTTKEQSERLLTLGLKKETADCSWISNTSNITYKTHWRSIMGWFEDGDLPAWSLHRLIEMIPKRIKYKNDYYHFDVFSEINGYMADYVDPDDNYYNLLGNRHNNLFEGIINLIEWLIKEGHFNKEYLEK